ncbi:EcoKI restriction-modification system protein [Streptomyces acidiscabies]|nr:EcoKI restriction-modification system protein [Streptomyces acidiscabies]
MRRTTTLRAAAEVVLGRQRAPQHDTGPHMVPYLRAANVKDGVLELGDVKEMNFTPAEQGNFSLRSGDVLVTEGSGSLKSVGASAVWRAELDGVVCFQNTLLRVRPREGVADGRFLEWWARSAFGSGLFASVATGANIYHISAERVRSLPVDLPDLDEQRRISQFLDVETGKLYDLVAKKQKLISLMEERIDSRVLRHVGESRLVRPEDGAPILPIRRILSKVVRPAVAGLGIITAYRDGQVTDRAARRAEGYTMSASSEPQGQNVQIGDVVVHGLDGFAGAIGASEACGNCSPVYHVCVPLHADPRYLGRLLRLLALQGYLGNFATSTRERAVDFRNWDLFGRIPIPNVPTAEQYEIGDWITRVRPLREVVERSAVLATERRQALITAAVTGQFDVSTASGRNVTDGVTP